MQQEQFRLHAELEGKHWWFLGRRQIMRALLDRCLGQTDTRPAHATTPERPMVIDVGCGTGGNIASLSDAYRCVGIDTSATGIQFAQARFPQVNFVCGQAPEALSVYSPEAAMWLLMDVLEHVPDDFAMLSSLLGAMKPGAKMLVTVPAHLHLWSQHDESFGHYRRYTHSRLQAVWADLPVRVHLLSYYNTHLYPIVLAIRSFHRWRDNGSPQESDFSLPSPWVNQALQRVFASERKRLMAQLDDMAGAMGTATHHSDPIRTSAMAYPTGVSLIAILERLKGPLAQRSRPAHMPPDHFQPTSS